MCWDSKPLKFMGDKTVSFDLFTKEQVRWKGYCPLKNIPTTFFLILMLPFCLYGERVSIYQQWVNAPKIRDYGLWPSLYRQVIKRMGRWQQCDLRITKFMRRQHAEEESDDDMGERGRSRWRTGNATEMLPPGLLASEMKMFASTSCPLPSTGEATLSVFWISTSAGERLHCGATMGIKWDDPQKMFSSEPHTGHHSVKITFIITVCLLT